MKKSTATALTLVASTLAIAAPVYFAISLARDLSLDAEANRSLVYAQDILRRTNMTVQQVNAGIQRLLAPDITAPCADATIDLMRQIDLGSSYVQSMGYMENDRLLCSSMGTHPGEGIALGAVDLVTSNGASVRKNVVFDFSGDQTFIMVERDGYAGIIHKQLPIDTTTQEPDALLAVYMLDNRDIATSRGTIRPEWIERLGDSGQVTFSDADYVVSVVKSGDYLVGAVAAIPLSYLSQRTRRFALLLVPIGLVAGGVLAFAVIHLARLQLALPTVLRTALKRKEFFLTYQPVVDLQTGRMVGAEALIRWRRADGEMVRPDLFIQVAEDEGIIQLITARVIELLADDLHDVFRRFPGFHIGINLSATDLHSQVTVTLLRQLAKGSRAGTGNFVVEATERGFVDPEMAAGVLGQLRESGMLVAIDDFGTGYSSLQSLQSLALDILKIDRAFVSTVGTDAPTSQVVTHIIQMAKSLRLKMVAEGVETEEQAAFLRAQGVHYAQGWLFGKPQSFEELLARLRQEAAAPAPVTYARAS